MLFRSLFGGLIVFSVGKVLMFDQIVGVDELVGLVGKTVSPLDPEGQVFVRGEYWNARADEAVEEGEAVEVTAIDGLRMTVRRAGQS